MTTAMSRPAVSAASRSRPRSILFGAVEREVSWWRAFHEQRHGSLRAQARTAIAWMDTKSRNRLPLIAEPLLRHRQRCDPFH